MRLVAGSCFLGLFLLGAGCSSGPKYRIDDGLLASVAVSEKQAMLGAKAEMDQAVEEKRKAEADLQVVERDLSVAQSEYGQAKLDVDKAEAEAKLAEQSKDLNRMNQSRDGLKRAKMARDIADAKIDWQKQRRRAGKSQVDVAERHLDAAASRYEQEKARLAQQKGMMPSKDFNVMNFDQQVITLQGKYDQARIEANKETLTASQREQKVNQLKGQFDQAYPGAGGAPPPPPDGQPGYAPPQGQPPAGQPQGQPQPGNPY
jgi:uncharacterized protein (DUF3084 family)